MWLINGVNDRIYFSWSSQVVGWPPIRSYRMNTLSNQAKTSSVEDQDKGIGGNENNESSKKKINHGSEKNNEATKERGHLGFVKVNMDGLPIGRKVDLNAHKSYESLAKTLEEMFFKPSQSTRRFSLHWHCRYTIYYMHALILLWKNCLIMSIWDLCLDSAVVCLIYIYIVCIWIRWGEGTIGEALGWIIWVCPNIRG